MNDLAKTLIFFGLVLAGSGLVLALFGKVPGLGKLPGDVYLKKGSFVFYFPVVTCLLLSVLLTAVLSIFGRK
ncbi:MAG: DUF2905 domain-containing protein [Candidatus Omnitrophica bacterium]|nr:DUF2905 domain-containing protein [Candidatus Omnitrophota bacterium]